MNEKLEAALAPWNDDGDAAPLIEQIPYAAWLDMQARHDEEGRILFHLPFRDSLIGNYKLPALHGGVTAGFAENAAVLHLLLTQTETRIPKTVDFSIDYLRSAHAADLYARCSVQRSGLRVAQLQVQVTQHEVESSDERTVAVARMHFLLRPRT